MSTLFIGARHLHSPVLSVLHGFLVLEDAHGRSTFSGDRGPGLFGAPLVGYEADYSDEHPDHRGVVALQQRWGEIDGDAILASFRATLNSVRVSRLTYNVLTCNCNTVITMLILRAGLELPPPPALFLPGYGRPIL